MTILQQKGAFVVNVGNCTDIYLDNFVAAGGKWVAPLLYDEDGGSVIEDNLASMPAFKDKLAQRGLSLALWANPRTQPVQNANDIVALTKQLKPSFLLLDCEAEFKYAGFYRMEPLLRWIRLSFPRKYIMISTYGNMDTTLDWPSIRKYNCRAAPQCYYGFSGWYDPSETMKVAKELKYPLSWVHPTISCVENQTIKEGTRRINLARQYGLAGKFSVFTLENMTSEDFEALKEA